MTTAELRQAARAFAQAVDMAAVGTGDGHARLVLAYRRYLVTLRPETPLAATRRRPQGRPSFFTSMSRSVAGRRVATPTTTSPPSRRWTPCTLPSCWRNW